MLLQRLFPRCVGLRIAINIRACKLPKTVSMAACLGMSFSLSRFAMFFGGRPTVTLSQYPGHIHRNVQILHDRPYRAVLPCQLLHSGGLRKSGEWRSKQTLTTCQLKTRQIKLGGGSAIFSPEQAAQSSKASFKMRCQHTKARG